MKVSVNWINEFTNIKMSVDELVRKIGSQLGEVESVVNYGEQYQGVRIAKVVTCEPHPNADRLQICKIDDGGVTQKVKRDSKGHVQVVCGAPNVRAGLTVAWIPPGAIVPSTYNSDQFKLDVRPLRGIDSNGMLASHKELGIGDSHEGILVVDKPAKPGASFADIYELNDYIIDIENKMFTHRPDCFGILGVAREIAGISQVRFKSPDWYLKSLPLKADKGAPTLPLVVKNKIPKLVPRFIAMSLSGVKVTKSPIIMQTYLARLGVKPINNVVDTTNFVMLLTAQPLHAYDYDKVVLRDGGQKATLVVRMSQKGDKVQLLNNKTVTPAEDTIVIATNTEAIGIGGVMGGRTTEVDFSTKNIIIECANFDMYSIRRTSMVHGLFTDAVTRFNKGQSPLQNDVVATYCVGMLQKLTHAKLAGPFIDTDADKSLPYSQTITVETDFINDRLGHSFEAVQIQALLENVEMHVKMKGSTLIVHAPFWRTDLEIPEDIVEEVGRLYGYDALPLKLPKRFFSPAPKNNLIEVKHTVRRILSNAGANEILSHSFVHQNLLLAAGQDPKKAFKLSNALSPDLQYYRLSLTPSLLDKVHMNVKAGYGEFALFEINKTHNKKKLGEDGLPKELEKLALVYVRNKFSRGQGAAYYNARRYLDELAAKLGTSFAYAPIQTARAYQTAQPFDIRRSAEVIDANTKKSIGIVGEYKPSVQSSLKLPLGTAGFEIGVQHLLEAPSKAEYRAISRFPSTHQDISFKVPAKTMFSEVELTIQKVLDAASRTKGYIYALKTLDIYQKGSSKHISFRITLSHYDRTLVTDEFNSLLQEAAVFAKKELKATRL